MVKTTLQVVESIENQALAVQAEYEAEIKEIRETTDQKLSTEDAEYRSKLDQKLEELENELKQQLEQAEDALEKTLTSNQERAEKALEITKTKFIPDIIKEVVNRYGN